tara:strand:+ start:69 stop:689 length:621 start_codon:yes stop_codon:yes gene_type:complete
MAFTMKHLGGGNPPTHMHGGDHSIDPVKEKAKTEAKTNASNAPKVYSGGSRNMVNNPDGTKTLTSTRNYTQTGTGKAKKSYKQLEAEGGDVASAKKFNATNSRAGKETESITSVNLKPVGITPSSIKISSTMPTITPKGPSTTPTPKKKKSTPPRKKSYIVQDTGRAIGDAGEAIGKGVKNTVSNIGYAFSRRGAIGSLFGCKTCR